MAIAIRRTEDTKTSVRWKVLQVMAHHEKRVAQHLHVREIDHYLPLYAERSQWTDRTVLIERTLFPGYIFANFPSTKRNAAITAPGVIRLLGDTDFWTVSAEELDHIREGLKNGYTIRPHPGIDVGVHVVVRGGAFDGVFGVVSQLREPCHVVIRLGVVQQSFSLETRLNCLEILSNPAQFRRPTAGHRMGLEGIEPER